MTTTRLQVSGYRFQVRRIEAALLHRDVGMVNEPLRPRAAAFAFGWVLAALGLAGCAVVALLRPDAGLDRAQIAMGQDSGALYVRVGDTWHPVLNLASARLITQTDEKPRPVRESAFRHTKRGALLGIPGAPQVLAPPLSGAESIWTMCDSAGKTTVLVGPAAGPRRRLAPDQGVLVAGGSGLPPQLLYRGHRALVDLADAAVQHALRFDGRVAHVVSPALLSAIPEAPRIAAPQLDAAGGRSTVMPGLRVGDVLRITPPELVDDVSVCATWTPGEPAAALSTGSGLPVPDGQLPVTLAQADGPGPALDEVYLPPGRSAYASSRSLSGGDRRAATRYLVIDTGVRFAIGDDNAAHDLGLPASASAAPWPVLATLPPGPELSRVKALVARDALTAP